eukprot:CAMPEP_0119318982 /NCGR_PEP_ID=MMETSP1333-20130426/48206_1 /TAXON_ID=418940 /ORGANISM="Scyphosphaera apsteinii, Strain RCC1455" /LENGTH=235 /DNA_ID=CAMNT_0007325301 /DNA_START=72 /DNA_END=776 /DNA_ORIENTATION=-
MTVTPIHQACRSCSRRASFHHRKGRIPGERSAFFEDARLMVLCRGRLRAPLDQHGFTVLDGIVPLDEAKRLRTDLQRLFKFNGHQASSLTHKRGLRSDLVNGISEHAALSENLSALYSAIRLIKGLGHEIAIALHDPRLTLPPTVQAACYPGNGSFYRRHTDNMPLHPESVRDVPTNLKEQLEVFELRCWRTYTIIVYANDCWEAKHGGCLRFHHEKGGFTDIEPVAGRAVFFNS